MRPERWKRVDALYHQAATRTGADRVAFLAAACADDDALRHEVESLLAHDGPAAAFLEEPALAVEARQIAERMPLLTGRRLGPYIVGPLIGAGGMGDVYRAHDTVLGRDVAIKILPETLDNDPARFASFEQEARVLASFSHPHIAAIYGVEEADGIRGLVLEFVDGERLEDRIRRGPMPLREALRIAREIAEALDAAHQRGIVHRDLKPANITMTADGVTKVLDFGLAKTAPTDASRVTSDESSSDDRRDTLVRGTAAYMSPEQARGAIVDKRSDIWAFGCLLYEMLAGRAAFSGKTTSQTVAAVVEREPDWTALSDVAGDDVCVLVRRCLEKDPKRRRRDVGDVLSDLDQLSLVRSNSAPRRSTSRSMVVVALSLATASIAVTASVVRIWRAPALASAAQLSNLSLLLPAGMEFPQADSQIAVSPDGTMIAFVGATPGDAPRIILKRMNAADYQVLSDTIDARDPFFSPDSRWIGFFAGDSLKKLSIADGKSQVIAQGTPGQSGWWASGHIVFGEGGDISDAGIRRIAENGGPVEVLSRPDRAQGEVNHLAPQLLPDGRTLLYTVRTIKPEGPTYSVVIQRAGGPARVLFADASYGRYVGNGALIYERGRSLFVTAFDAATLTAAATGTALFTDLSHAPNSSRPAWAAGGDVLVYRPRSDNMRFVWVTRSGRELSLSAPVKPYSSPSLSPQGDRIAVEIGGDGKFDIWIVDLARQTLTKLTSDGLSRYPMWTPDGRHLGMVRRRTGSMDLYWQTPEGSEVRELVRGEYPSWIGSWTPDARTLIYMQENPTTDSDLWTIEMEGEHRSRPLVQTPAREYGGRLSPDGRWLSYFSDATGRFELYVTPFHRRHPQWQVSRDGARESVWSRDGDELFYRSDARMMSVKIPKAETSSPGRPALVFERDYFQIGGPGIVNYDVTPDGTRFLMLKRADNEVARLAVVQGLTPLTVQHLPPQR